MVFFNKPTVLALFYLLLQALSAFSEESNEEQVKHTAHALFRKVKAGVESIAAKHRAKESAFVSNANKNIVDFREYIFKNYDVRNRKVDECVNKALSAIENNDFSPTDCRQREFYIEIHDKVLEEFSEENIIKKANELCGDLKNQKSSKAVECTQKAFKEIDKKYSKQQTKEKLDELVEHAKKCLKKQKQIYRNAKKQVQKCPKK